MSWLDIITQFSDGIHVNVFPLFFTNTTHWQKDGKIVSDKLQCLTDIFSSIIDNEAKGYVSMHNGWLEIDNNDKIGSCFLYCGGLMKYICKKKWQRRCTSLYIKKKL